MIRENEVYKIGVLAKTHGVSGELSMSFTDDIFDRVDTDYLICRMDGILVPFFLEEYRFKSRSTALVKFEDIDTEDEARKMAGVEVFFPKALAGESEDQIYSWSYFVGFGVTDEQAGYLGNVESVDESTVNVLFEVKRPDGRDLLIPAHEEFIRDIDHDGNMIYVCLPDGLSNLYETDFDGE